MEGAAAGPREGGADARRGSGGTSACASRAADSCSARNSRRGRHSWAPAICTAASRSSSQALEPVLVDLQDGAVAEPDVVALDHAVSAGQPSCVSPGSRPGSRYAAPGDDQTAPSRLSDHSSSGGVAMVVTTTMKTAAA